MAHHVDRLTTLARVAALVSLVFASGCRDATGPLPTSDPPDVEGGPLSVPAGATEVHVGGVNASGDVVGTVRFGFDDLGNPDFRAFVWRAGQPSEVGPGFAFGISESGRLVGSGDAAVVWEASDGAWTRVDLPGDPLELFSWGAAWSVSPSGRRVAGFLPKKADFRGRAVIWTESLAGVWSLEALPAAGSESDAFDVNDEGVVVGWVGPPFRPAAWTKGSEGAWTTRFLGQLFGHSGGRATAINEVGDIVGYSDDLEGFGARHGVIWRRTGPASWSEPVVVGDPAELERRGFERIVIAADIDEPGRVVGTALTLSGIEHAFVRLADGRMIDLTPDETAGSAARSINGLGEIVGSTAGDPAFVWRLR